MSIDNGLLKVVLPKVEKEEKFCYFEQENQNFEGRNQQSSITTFLRKTAPVPWAHFNNSFPDLQYESSVDEELM